ncbi:hypothetical protein DXZ75_06380 [Streptomyces sp. AcE210]|nr:hypothetical protein DXZ75_06380 [Streptomyces sp. AcE210]
MLAITAAPTNAQLCDEEQAAATFVRGARTAQAGLGVAGVAHFADQNIAQLRGNVSGADLVAAVAAGLEVTCRLGVAVQVDIVESGFLYSSLLGYFGATAAAGRALGLTGDEMVNAFGIVYCSVAGNHQVPRDASLMKRLQSRASRHRRQWWRYSRRSGESAEHRRCSKARTASTACTCRAGSTRKWRATGSSTASSCST